MNNKHISLPQPVNSLVGVFIYPENQVLTLYKPVYTINYMELPSIKEFIWDNGNNDKNYIKHGVTNTECEEIFFDQDKKIHQDATHSQKEFRFLLIGKTKNKRSLFVVFIVRKNKIRVISARDLNKREYKLYEN